MRLCEKETMAIVEKAFGYHFSHSLKLFIRLTNSFTFSCFRHKIAFINNRSKSAGGL